MFTGEIGWGHPEVRTDVVAALSPLGMPRDSTAESDGDGPVSLPGAAVPVVVVRPREELRFRRDTLAAL